MTSGRISACIAVAAWAVLSARTVEAQFQPDDLLVVVDGGSTQPSSVGVHGPDGSLITPLQNPGTSSWTGAVALPSGNIAVVGKIRRLVIRQRKRV